MSTAGVKRTVLMMMALAALLPAWRVDAQTIDLGSGGADQIWRGTAAGSKASLSLDLGGVSVGDSRRDLVIGAPGGSGVPGAVYVIFGGPVRSGEMSLSSADATLSSGAADDRFGHATAVGNIFLTEGTIPRDIAVGAPNAFGGKGAVYVFVGGFTNGENISAASARLTIIGQAGDQLGTALATGDLDNDGYREVIIGAPGNARVYIIKGGAAVSGTKDLSVVAADRVLAGSGIGSVLAAGDVTGDGTYDLLVGRPSENFVYLFAGGNGTIPSQADATWAGGDAGDEAGASIRILDVDDDGFRDVVIGAPGGDGPGNTRANAGEAHILWGGAGLLVSRDLSATADVTIYGGAAGMRMGAKVEGGDINRDTPNDIVLLAPGAANGGQMYIYYGRERSSIGTIIGGRRVVDFASTSPSRIVTGDPAAGPMETAVVFEVTGEGARDLIVGVPSANGNEGAVYFTISPRLTLSTNGVNATVQRGQFTSTSVSVANPSLIEVPWTLAPSHSWLTVSPVTGASSKDSTPSFTLNISAANLAPGTYNGSVSVTSNTEHLMMTYSVPVSLTVTAAPAPPGESGEDTDPGSTPPALDVDGRLDLVWQHAGTGDIAAWNMDGFSLFDSAWTSPQSSGPAWKVRATADFNRDGLPDLVFHHTDGWVAVWFMTGTAVQDTRLLTIPRVNDTNWQVVGAADMNNDLRADILWQHQTTGQIAVWLMWDNQVLDTRSIATVSPAWRLAGVGDLTRDNRPDLIFQHTDGTIAAWFMNGLTVDDTRVISVMADTNWQVRGVRDMNNDLRGDLIFHHQTGGWLATWLMWDNSVLDTRWLTPNQISDTNWRLVGVR